MVAVASVAVRVLGIAVRPPRTQSSVDLDPAALELLVRARRPSSSLEVELGGESLDLGER